MRILTALAATLAVAAAARAEETVDCGSDTTLTDYLVSLLGVLFDSGLTVFEQLVVAAAETDSGFDLLSALADAGSSTLLAPSDTAFAAAGVASGDAAFDGWGEWELVGLLALHAVQGTTGGVVPAFPLDGVATTYLSIQDSMNSSTGSSADQVVVLVQDTAAGGAVTALQAAGNVTAWSAPVDTSSAGLGNLDILPLDAVLSAPPNLTQALADTGLTKLSAALASDLPTLEQLTPSGFTIFAPVDAAWTAEVESAVSASAGVLASLYTTSYTLYSPAWYGPGTFPSLALDSGAAVSVTYNGTGHYVTLGETTATILRADVALENGVMHIIDAALFDTAQAGTGDTAAAGAHGSATGASTGAPSASGSTSTSGAIASTSISARLVAGLVGVLGAALLGLLD